MLKKSRSADSWELPWNVVLKNTRPQMVHSTQTGRNVGEIAFILCCLGVFMLSSSLVLIGVSIWSLIKKSLLSYLLNIKVDIPYFSIPAALILLPGFWIALSIHNDEAKRNCTLTLLLLIFLSSSLLIVGSIVGLLYSIEEDSYNLLSLTSSLRNEDLNKSIGPVFLRYGKVKDEKYAWDKLQQHLGCCGLESWKDWEVINLDIPLSCCRESVCTPQNSFPRPCLDSISRDLVWQQNILKSHCYVMTVAQIVNGIVSYGFYISDKYAK